MNINNMRKLRSYIAGRSSKLFDMSYWVSVARYSNANDGCGTAGCIAGHTVMMESQMLCDSMTFQDASVVVRELMSGGVTRSPAKILDLSEDEARALFLPRGVLLDQVTQADALKVLDRCIATGRVDPIFWESVIDRQGRRIS